MTTAADILRDARAAGYFQIRLPPPERVMGAAITLPTSFWPIISDYIPMEPSCEAAAPPKALDPSAVRNLRAEARRAAAEGLRRAAVNGLQHQRQRQS